MAFLERGVSKNAEQDNFLILGFRAVSLNMTKVPLSHP
jgi:hypothetical protein